MTRETVTLLFTDLVGSTELASRVGPGPADELRREHFALLRGGAADDGQEIKNLGDGLMFAFRSAAGAVDAAVSMQQALATRNRKAQHQLEVRIGIAFGDATVEDGDYFGEPVIQAARLCAHAQPGQILLTDLAHAVAGTGSAHTFASVGPLTLKGLPAPVSAHEVVWTPLTRAGLPLPIRMRGAPEAAFVGREEERERLAHAWKMGRAGQGSLVLLSGEPGIGKTRLASEAARIAHQDGGVVLYGSCDDGVGVPYQPWIEALRHYVEYAPDEALRSYAERCGPDLAHLVPELRQRVPDLPAPASASAETERYLLFEAVVQLLRAATTHDPVFVVFDDLHWADRPTLVLLTHFVKTLADEAIVVVGTYRDSELSQGHPLSDALGTLHREPHVERVGLRGLRQPDIAAFLAVASGQELGEDGYELAMALERDTAGNPFFVAEVLRHLLEQGALVQGEDGLWEVSASLDDLAPPESVREVVGQRVARLGPDAQTALSAAAVIGREFELALLGRVLEVDEDPLLDLLEQAMAASVLTEAPGRPDTFSFVHALITHTLYEDLGRARRARLHRKVALAIEDVHGASLDEHYGALARHWAAATESVDTAKSIDYGQRAGRQALESLAPHEALRWFRQALELQGEGDPARRCDLLINLGEAQRDSGEAGFRDTLVEAAGMARRLGDSDRLAAAVLATFVGFTTSAGNPDVELLDAMEAAVEAHTERDARRARLLAQLGLELHYVAPLERRRALVDEALEIARSLDDRPTLVHVQLCRYWALLTAHTLDERIELVREVTQLTADAGDPYERFAGAIQACHVAIEAGDRARFETCLERARELVRPLPHPTAQWLQALLEVVVHSISGRVAAAEDAATQALELGLASGITNALAAYAANLTTLRYEQGRMGEMVDLVAQAAVDNPTLSSLPAMHALALCEAGRDEEAGVLLERAFDAGFDSLPKTQLWGSTIQLWASIAYQVRNREAALALYGLAAPFGATDLMVWSSVACWGTWSQTLAVLAATLGREQEAEAFFNAAEAQHARFGAAHLVARSRFEHARALLDGEMPAPPARIAGLLQAAATAWRECGCDARADRADALLAQARDQSSA